MGATRQQHTSSTKHTNSDLVRGSAYYKVSVVVIQNVDRADLEVTRSILVWGGHVV